MFGWLRKRHILHDWENWQPWKEELRRDKVIGMLGGSLHYKKTIRYQERACRICGVGQERVICEL